MYRERAPRKPADGTGSLVDRRARIDRARRAQVALVASYLRALREVESVRGSLARKHGEVKAA